MLGPDGAGESTAVEILQGHRSRDAGEVTVLGRDPASGGRQWRSRAGTVWQDESAPAELTVRETVRHFARSSPRSRDPDEVVRPVGLESRAGSRIKALSGGRRRRLDVALGVVGAPVPLLLDGPTTGFDPAARRPCGPAAVPGADPAVGGRRERLTREIHDTLAQGFTSLLMPIQAVASEPAARHAAGPPPLGPHGAYRPGDLAEARALGAGAGPAVPSAAGLRQAGRGRPHRGGHQRDAAGPAAGSRRRGPGRSPGPSDEPPLTSLAQARRERTASTTSVSGTGACSPDSMSFSWTTSSARSRSPATIA